MDDSEFPEYGYRVKKVIARVMKEGKEYANTYDLIFDEENRPWVVFSWLDTPDGRVPHIRVEILGSLLSPVANARAEYFYPEAINYPSP